MSSSLVSHMRFQIILLAYLLMGPLRGLKNAELIKKVIVYNVMSYECLNVTVTGRICVRWCDREDINLWQIPSTYRSCGSYPSTVSFGALV